MLASENFQSLSAQFVLLKIKSGSDENKLWSQFHQKKQAAIPQVYIIRSDGTELYNEVGGMGEDGLKKLMEESLAKAGKPIDIKVAKQLGTTADKIKRMVTSKKFGSAVELFKNSSELLPVSRESFAMAAVYFEKVREQLDAGLKEELSRLKAKVSESPSASVKQKIQLAESTMALLDQVEGLENVATEANELKTELKAQLSEIVTDLELAASPDTSLADLEKIRERYSGTAFAKRLESKSREDGKPVKVEDKAKADSSLQTAVWMEAPDQIAREWKSGNFSVKATLLAVSLDKVKLKKEDGTEIKVSISKLSKEDQSLIESVRKKSK